MNAYYDLLLTIIETGGRQKNKKGDIRFLINQTLRLSPRLLDRIFREHPIAKKKLRDELDLYMRGVTSVAEYNKVGITWWDYCAPEMVNTYPDYFKKLPALIEKINKEKRPSKNYVLFLGVTGEKTSQLPCINLFQFQIVRNKLHMTVFQRSADSNLGLPSDLYQAWLISEMIDLELGSITFYIGNAHIYENNIQKTKNLLSGEKVTFELNV